MQPLQPSFLILAQNDAGTGFGIVALILIVLASLIALFLLIFSIWMFFDALLHQPTPVEKLLWAALIFFFSPIAPIIYWFVARDRASHQDSNP